MYTIMLANTEPPIKVTIMLANTEPPNNVYNNVSKHRAPQ